MIEKQDYWKRNVLLKIRYMIAIIAVLVAAICLFFLASERKVYQTTVFSMDTFVEMKFYGRNGEKAAAQLTKELSDYEAQISPYLPNSEISRLNSMAGMDTPYSLSEQTYDLLEKSKRYSLESGGLFDITIAPLSKLWGITSENPHIPTDEEISKTRILIDASQLILNEEDQTAYLSKEGQGIDLGGIAKGAATEIVSSVMDKFDIKNGYVSLGGNMVVRGYNPIEKCEFRFGIRDPRGGSGEYIADLPLRGKTMATTGDYERFFMQDGKRYHHVLDPRTGYPAESGLISVSVVSEDGALADFLSTALFVGGKESVLVASKYTQLSLIAVDCENQVYVSKNLQGILTPNSEKMQYTFYYI